jgi:hypothetical protein
MVPAQIRANPAVASVARSLMLDAAAVHCVSALRAAGIRAILLKGPVTARWLYSDAGNRDYTDVDLLVARGELRRALRILGGLGYRDTQADRSPNETPTHARALALEPSSGPRGSVRFPTGLLVDLHWTFHGIGAPDAEFWGVVTGDAERMRITGTEIEIPSEPTRTLLLSLHAATTGAIAGRALADLDRGLERLADETWVAAHELARQLDALPRFIAGLRMRPVGRELIGRLHLEGDMDALSAMRAVGVPPVAGGLERLRTTHGLGPRMLLLARELVPTRSFMRNWSPLARRGAVGLALAYAYRPFALALKLPAALRAHARARRAVATGAPPVDDERRGR